MKGCAAVYDGWKAMRRGDRDQALDRLAEAQWQYEHSNFIRDRASEVARVERRVRAGADLSAEALTTWHDLKPWQCYRG